MTLNQIKKLQNITNILNAFLEPFDCEAAASTDFAYYTASNTISYAFVVSDEHADSFLKFTHSLFPNINANVFLWSFFHELGHHEAEDDFEDEEWEEYREKASKCSSDEEYYNLPIEYAATYWAGQYMTNHYNEIKKLWNDLIPAIKNFYHEMEVE